MRAQVEAETIDESYTEEEKKKAMRELLETDLEKAERKHALEELENAVTREDARLKAERKEAEEVLSEAASEFEAKQKAQQAAERKEAEDVLADAVSQDQKDRAAEKDAAGPSSAPEKPEAEAKDAKKVQARDPLWTLTAFAQGVLIWDVLVRVSSAHVPLEVEVYKFVFFFG